MHHYHISWDNGMITGFQWLVTDARGKRRECAHILDARERIIALGLGAEVRRDDGTTVASFDMQGNPRK